MRVQHTGYVVPGWGAGDLWTSPAAVLAHEFRFADGAGAGLAGEPVERLEAEEPVARLDPEEPDDLRDPDELLDPEELVERFQAFLAGAEVGFGDVRLDLEGLTAFQVAVAASLRSVSRGEVVSYAELAALAGYPGAQRAVGTFCARNRFAFLLPCHRVVGATGIGSYGAAGVAAKRRLLGLEGVVL